MPVVIRVDKVVASYDVWVGPMLPFAHFRVKVKERDTGDFLAVPNVLIRMPSGDFDYTAGLGDSVEVALNDLLERFSKVVEEVTRTRPIAESDLEWASPDEF